MHLENQIVAKGSMEVSVDFSIIFTGLLRWTIFNI